MSTHTTATCLRCPRTSGRRRRGLCDKCYWHAWNHGYLHNYPSTRRRLHLEDVRELADRHVPRVEVARRLGVSYSAVSMAEWRARKRGDAS